MTVVRLHRTPDDPIIPEGIPIPGPRPSRPDHPPVSEPDSPPPPAKEPPAPARRDQLAGMGAGYQHKSPSGARGFAAKARRVIDASRCDDLAQQEKHD
jgi:hypothetical protein